jgi:hypothetical protein
MKNPGRLKESLKRNKIEFSAKWSTMQDKKSRRDEMIIEKQNPPHTQPRRGGIVKF